jgi:bacteriocin-like protein
MKKLAINEMQKIQGGGLAVTCFGLGAVNAISLNPWIIYVSWPVLKYCWNH